MSNIQYGVYIIKNHWKQTDHLYSVNRYDINIAHERAHRWNTEDAYRGDQYEVREYNEKSTT